MRHADLNRAHRQAVDTPWSDRPAARHPIRDQWRTPPRRTLHLNADSFDPLLVRLGRRITGGLWTVAILLAVGSIVWNWGGFLYAIVAWHWQ